MFYCLTGSLEFEFCVISVSPEMCYFGVFIHTSGMGLELPFTVFNAVLRRHPLATVDQYIRHTVSFQENSRLLGASYSLKNTAVISM